MDFDSPDVMKDFPGLYASELNKQCNNDSDYSDENDKVMKKDILIGKRKEKKDKERGYAALEGESSADENFKSRSPSKSKKAKSFKFTTKAKEKRDKSREKDKDADRKKDRDKKNDKKVDKEKVKGEKTKKFKSCDETGDIGELLPIFGTSLDLAVERSRCHDGVNVPLPVRECIDYIEANGGTFEGVYKVSGTKSKVLHLRKMYNQRETVNLSDYDVPTITSLLKTFLRDLPEPIFTHDLLIRFEEAGAILNLKTREKHLKILIDNLPASNKLLLAFVVTHLNNISLNEKCNKMNKQSLAAALNHTFHCSSRLLNGLLHHSQSLFPYITISKYIPPLESGAKLPDVPEQIETELKKQESLLSQIHKEMNLCCISKEREELLWEVQRIITQLKRKLKSFNKDREAEKPVVAEKVEAEVPVQHENKKEEKPVAAECTEDTETVTETVIIDACSTEAMKEDSAADLEELPEAEQQAPEEPKSDEAEVPTASSAAAFGEGLVTNSALALLKLKNEGFQQLKGTLLKHIQAEHKEIAMLQNQLSAAEKPANHAAAPHGGGENLDEVMNLILKENQILQIKKINLVRQIIEEQETCIDLKAQIISNI